jgi:hypothetical protein
MLSEDATNSSMIGSENQKTFQSKLSWIVDG